MRKCLRCEKIMVEDLVFKVQNGGNGIDVRERGLIKLSLDTVKCAVCPECGYVETYIDNLNDVKKIAANKK